MELCIGGHIIYLCNEKTRRGKGEREEKEGKSEEKGDGRIRGQEKGGKGEGGKRGGKREGGDREEQGLKEQGDVKAMEACIYNLYIMNSWKCREYGG